MRWTAVLSSTFLHASTEITVTICISVQLYTLYTVTHHFSQVIHGRLQLVDAWS